MSSSFGNSILVAFFSCLICCACSNDNTAADEPETVAPLEVATLVDDISDFVSDVSIVKLSGDLADMIFSPSKILVGEEFYVVLSGNVPFAVDKTGRVLGQYGRFGRGPGEYLMVRDICFSTSGNQLWCLSADNSVLRYDLESMSYIDKTEVDLRSQSASAILPMGEKQFALFVPNPESSRVSDFSEPFYCLKSYDFSGAVQKEDMLRTDFNISAAFSVPSAHSGGNVYTLSPGSLDMPILVLDGRKCSNLFIDFQDKALPSGYAFKGVDDPWQKISDIFIADYYKLVGSVLKFDGGMYFCAFGQRSSLWNFVIFEGSGIFWRSVSMNSKPLNALSSDGQSLLYICGDLLEEGPESYTDPLKRIVIDRCKDQIDSDSQYLISVKFHEN